MDYYVITSGRKILSEVMEVGWKKHQIIINFGVRLMCFRLFRFSLSKSTPAYNCRKSIKKSVGASRFVFFLLSTPPLSGGYIVVIMKTRESS